MFEIIVQIFSFSNSLAIVGIILSILAFLNLFARMRIDLESFLEDPEEGEMQPNALIAIKLYNLGFFKLKGEIFVKIDKSNENKILIDRGNPNNFIRLFKSNSRKVNIKNGENVYLRVLNYYNYSPKEYMNVGLDYNSDILEVVFIRKVFGIPVFKHKRIFSYRDEIRLIGKNSILSSAPDLKTRFDNIDESLHLLFRRTADDEERARINEKRDRLLKEYEENIDKLKQCISQSNDFDEFMIKKRSLGFKVHCFGSIACVVINSDEFYTEDKTQPFNVELNPHFPLNFDYPDTALKRLKKSKPK